MTGLFVLFAVVALWLAALGVYAVTHAVGRRTSEIGVRMALGATPAHVWALVFQQGMLPVGIGLLVGLGGALALMPLLRSQLVGVSPVDPITFMVAAMTLIAAAACGGWMAAYRATRMDPGVALRHE